MFSKQIIDSDAFLDMSPTAQLLYFHLVMRADDEGFVGNPKKIMREVGIQGDDFKILIAKRFILTFESGVIVIKHWLIHNTIRMDRFNQTSYQDEKKLIGIKKNNSYTELSNVEGREISKIEDKEKPKWLIDRNTAYKESELPDSFSYKIRLAFIGKECPICKIKMQGYEFSDNKRPTIQHNKPISQGGKHEINNISVVCRECNVSIQDKETGELNNKEVIGVWNTVGNQSVTQVKLSEVKLSEVKLEKTPSQIAKSFFKGTEDYLSLLSIFSLGNNKEIIEREFKKFVLYWTELNKSGTKQRWETERTFEVKKRLYTWMNRVKEFNKQSITKYQADTV